MSTSPTPRPPSRRAAIYLRISDDKEGRELGVARQEKLCHEVAAREGLTITAVYSDNDISASTNSRKVRPEWDRMLDDAEAGLFDIILAYSSSRLTRRPSERETLIELYDEHGTQPWFCNSGMPDLATSTGRTTFRLLGTIDTAEPERTSELVRAKQLELAQAGRYNGPRPFGWDLIGKGSDQRLVINQAEAEVIRELVRRVLAGEAIWKLAIDLNARGITTSKGGPWATQVLRRMLLRWANAGYRKHQPTKRGKPHGPPSLYPAQWEPIIARETHERVVATLTDPGRRSHNRGTAPKYLLTSIALCGVCDRHVVGTAGFTYEVKGGLRKDGSRGPTRTRNYPPSYKCPHAGCQKVQRRMADVDEVVEKYVVAVLERNGVTFLGGDGDAAAAAEKRIAELEAKLDLYADQAADDLITNDQLVRMTSRLRPQLEAERIRLRTAQPREDLKHFAGRSASDAWAAADVETKKRLLRLLADAIELRVTLLPVGAGNGAIFDPESVRVTWRE